MPRRKLVIEEVQHRYCALIAVGCTRRQAAALMGFNESTIRTAINYDARFAAAVRESEQRREILPLAKLQTAGQRSWKAHVWYLEQLNPREYRSRDDGPRRRNERFPLDLDDLDLDDVGDDAPPNDDRPFPRVSSPMQSDLPDREGPSS